MRKILIANRGEIACRIIRTCREMGIATVAVASAADLNAQHLVQADEWRFIGPAPTSESYLKVEHILEAARETGADAIHPGFGFLSENADFAQRVQAAGLTFIGPDPQAIRLMGSKAESKRLAVEAKVPVVPGYHGENQDPSFLHQQACAIGFPVLVKASAGGGGKGMRIVNCQEHFHEALEAAKREAKSAFGDDRVLLEKYLTRPRHIEFQIFGDQQGQVVHLFERECSIQRRHQKILEETPSTALSETTRAQMAASAVAMARAVGYSNAGTVEFIFDEDGSFYFLEMNTRLQVEHPITEMLTGQDLVRWQIEVARGKPLPMSQDQIVANGHAIEVRIYAEDPEQNFFPQTGRLERYREPNGTWIRVDSGVQEGDEVSIYYDPMIAKLIAWAPTRDLARERLRAALSEYCIHGVKTNISLLRAILAEPHFAAGETFTDYLSRYFPNFKNDASLVNFALMLTPLARKQGIAYKQSKPFLDPWEQLRNWRGGQ